MTTLIKIRYLWGKLYLFIYLFSILTWYKIYIIFGNKYDVDATHTADYAKQVYKMITLWLWWWILFLDLSRYIALSSNVNMQCPWPSYDKYNDFIRCHIVRLSFRHNLHAKTFFDGFYWDSLKYRTFFPESKLYPLLLAITLWPPSSTWYYI